MKKNNLVLIVIIVIVVLVLLSLISRMMTRRVGQRLGERIAEKIIEKGTGAKVDINAGQGRMKIKGKGGTLEFAGETRWPADLPQVVPQFKYGQVKGVTRMEDNGRKTWNVLLENIASDAYENYKKDLKSAGWEVNYVETSQGNSLQAEKGELALFVIIDSQEKKANLTLGYK